MSSEDTKVGFHKKAHLVMAESEKDLQMNQENLLQELIFNLILTDSQSITSLTPKLLNLSKTSIKLTEETELWKSLGSILKSITISSLSRLSENNIFHGSDGLLFSVLPFQCFGFSSTEKLRLWNKQVFFLLILRDQGSWSRKKRTLISFLT